MTKAQIIKEVVKATGIDTRDVELIVEATLMGIKKNVKAGKRVDFRGFGCFFPKYHKEKKGRRPIAGHGLQRSEVINVPARIKPVFKPSKKHFACSI